MGNHSNTQNIKFVRQTGLVNPFVSIVCIETPYMRVIPQNEPVLLVYSTQITRNWKSYYPLRQSETDL